MLLTGRYILNQNCVLNRIFREKVSDSEALLQAVRFVRSRYRPRYPTKLLKEKTKSPMTITTRLHSKNGSAYMNCGVNQLVKGN